jgi:hypothetical protein
MGTVVTCSTVLAQVLAGVTEENHKKRWQGYFLPKPEVPEHETGMLTIQPIIQQFMMHKSQRSVGEVSIVVRWLVKTCFSSNEDAHNS